MKKLVAFYIICIISILITQYSFCMEEQSHVFTISRTIEPITQEYLQTAQIETQLFFANNNNAQLIQDITTTGIALYAAWHAAQVQDQQIEFILFSKIMSILSHQHIETTQSINITNTFISIIKQQIAQERTIIQQIACRTFDNKIALGEKRIDAIIAAQDAIRRYLQNNYEQQELLQTVADL